MKQRTQLILVGLVGYAVFAVATAPASLLPRLTGQQLQAGSLTGTLWRGKATGVRFGTFPLANVEWSVNSLYLLLGKISADVRVTYPQGFANARVAAGIGGKVTLSDVTASLPIDSLLGNGGLPGGWTGMAQIKMPRITLANNWPTYISGTVDVVDITGPASAPVNLGNYRLAFADVSTAGKSLAGEVQDIAPAKIAVRGTLTLDANRGYQLDVLVGPRPETPPDIVQGMQLLGAPDAEGLRPFSVSGTL